MSHEPGRLMLSASAGPVSVLAWDLAGGNGGLGLTFPLGGRKRLNLGIGAFIAYRTDEFIGTRVNFLLRGSYCWTSVCVSAAHLSHGRIFGFEENAPNKGLNFVYLEYPFK